MIFLKVLAKPGLEVPGHRVRTIFGLRAARHTGDTRSPLGRCLTEDALREHLKTVTKCAFQSSPACGERCSGRDSVLSMQTRAWGGVCVCLGHSQGISACNNKDLICSSKKYSALSLRRALTPHHCHCPGRFQQCRAHFLGSALSLPNRSQRRCC